MGLVLLSAGRDRTVRTWDLTKVAVWFLFACLTLQGRQVFLQTLKVGVYMTNVLSLMLTEPDLIRWSPSGKYYAILMGSKVEVLDDV
jgi:hypothetical protein